MSGDLQSVDGYMNIALERCKEIAEGKVVRNWGDAFVRGNNGMYQPHALFYREIADDCNSHIYLCGQRID